MCSNILNVFFTKMLIYKLEKWSTKSDGFLLTWGVILIFDINSRGFDE